MNTYSVTTGVLVFDGEPIITDGLKAWLEPLLTGGCELLPAAETGLGQTGLGLYEEDDSYIQIEDLEGAVRLALRAHGEEPGADEDVQDLVEDLIDASGQRENAAWLVDLIQSGEELDASELVRCALMFADGHNARAAALQTGVFSDKTRLWSFGGYTELVQRRADGTVDNTVISPRAMMVKALRSPHDLAGSMGALATELVPPENAEAFLGTFIETFNAQAPDGEPLRPFGDRPAG